MRPNSITIFEQLFFLSLALSVLGFFTNFDTAIAQLKADPNMAALGMGSGFLVGTLIFSLAVSLLLWLFIARKGSTIAKWIFVFFYGLGILLSLPSLFTAGLSLVTAVNLVSVAVSTAMIYFLFQPDTKSWFSKDGPSDPEVFN